MEFLIHDFESHSNKSKNVEWNVVHVNFLRFGIYKRKLFKNGQYDYMYLLMS